MKPSRSTPPGFPWAVIPNLPRAAGAASRRPSCDLGRLGRRRSVRRVPHPAFVGAARVPLRRNRHDRGVGLSDRDRKLLWGKAANRCAVCRTLLTRPASEPDRDAIIGDEAHITGEKPGAARYQPLEPSVRDGYGNRILVCRNHHGEIDQQPVARTVGRLRRIKIRPRSAARPAPKRVVPERRRAERRSRSACSQRATSLRGGGVDVFAVDLRNDVAPPIGGARRLGDSLAPVNIVEAVEPRQQLEAELLESS